MYYVIEGLSVYYRYKHVRKYLLNPSSFERGTREQERLIIYSSFVIKSWPKTTFTIVKPHVLLLPSFLIHWSYTPWIPNISMRHRSKSRGPNWTMKPGKYSPNYGLSIHVLTVALSGRSVARKCGCNYFPTILYKLDFHRANIHSPRVSVAGTLCNDLNSHH